MDLLNYPQQHFFQILQYNDTLRKIIIDKTRGNPSPPFLIIDPKEAPTKNRSIHANDIKLYLIIYC